jgi:ATP-binding cassette subfamily C protein CydC
MKTILRLLKFLQPYTGWVLLSILLGVATVASNIGLLGTSAFLIARAAQHPSIADLQVAIVGVRFFGISRSVFRYLERLVSHSVNFRLLGQLRIWFYQQVEPLAPAGLQDVSSGDLLNRAIGDIETLQDFYVRVVSPVVSALVITAGMGVFVGVYDPFLALIVVGGLVTSGAGLPLLARWLSLRIAFRTIELRSSLSAGLVELIQGLPDLLAFNQARARLDAILELGKEYGQAQTGMGWRAAFVNGAHLLVVNLTLWLVVYFAIPLVRLGAIDGVSLAVLALVTYASFEAVSTLGQAAQNLQAALPAAERLFKLSDSVPPVGEPAFPLPAPENCSITIREVSLIYKPGQSAALDDVSFDLPPGKRVAIVGNSGAGKSSIFNVLLRFWEISQGRILVNGRDIRAYASGDLRRKMTAVLQDGRLLSGSLRENLLLGRPSASDRELLVVLERVMLGDWLRSLPHGLESWVGERGVKMSGGERQQLAIARSLLNQDAALFLLDEPTSQLDPETGRSLVNVLLEATRGRSVLWITHDLFSLEKMDEILVMQEGRIVERGSHAGLLSRQGRYAKLSGTFNRSKAS